MPQSLRILLLSSRPISHSANLAGDLATALQEAGHEVHFFVHPWLEPGADLSSDQAKRKQAQERKNKRRKWAWKIQRLLHGYSLKKRCGIQLVCLDERHPGIEPKEVASAIPGEYDLVITLFWQDMIAAKTLQCLYERLQAPILIYAVDMFPITGGCFYFRHCDRYQKRCGCCPALGGRPEWDDTRRNWLLKEEVYASIRCAFLGNSWMLEHARKSRLFREDQLERALMIINNKRFRRQDPAESRRALGIPAHKRFVLFAGAQNIFEERKGFKQLQEAVRLFADRLNDSEREEVVLLLAGNQPEGVDFQSLFAVDVIPCGMLSMDRLATAYAATSCYLSPSLDDAGPSMVNQSLMCGTPVVAFSTGVALDLVQSGKSGYRARLKDAEDFAQGIERIYRLQPDAYALLRERCYQVAQANCSPAVLARTIEQIADRMREQPHKK